MNLKKRVFTFLGSLILTFAVFRLALFLMPFNNFDIAGYNIHHVFTGALILMVSIVAFVFEMRNLFFVALAGVGSAMILDEIVYLIVTMGTDLDYLTPVSFYGALIFIFLLSAVTLTLYFAKSKK